LFLGNHLRNAEMAERDIQVSVINTHAEKGSEEYATKPSLDGVNLFLRA